MLKMKHVPLSVAFAFVLVGALLALPSFCFADASDASDSDSLTMQSLDGGDEGSDDGSDDGSGNNVSISDEDITPGGSDEHASEPAASTPDPAPASGSSDVSDKQGASKDGASASKKSGSKKAKASKASKSKLAAKTKKSAKKSSAARSASGNADSAPSVPVDPNPSISSNASQEPVAASAAPARKASKKVSRSKAAKKVVKKAERVSFDSWDGSADTSWYFGNEDEQAYVIETAEQLAGLSELVNSGYGFAGKSFTLAENLDLAGHEWNAIGSKSYFMGSFDGNGKIIKAVTSENAGSYAGLFGATYRASLKNIRLVDVALEGEQYVGGVVGLSYGDTAIESCTVSGKVRGDYFVGGVVGLAYTAGGEQVASGCSYDGTLQANEYSGDIVGFTQAAA